MKALAPLKCLSNCVIGSLHYQPWPHNLMLIIRGQRWTRPPFYLGLSGCSRREQNPKQEVLLYVPYSQMLIINSSFFSRMTLHINQNTISCWVWPKNIFISSCFGEALSACPQATQGLLPESSGTHKQRMLSELLPHNAVCYQLDPQMENTFHCLKC